MGSFKQHLAGAIITAGACGAVSHSIYHARLEDSAAAGLICIFGGILPDVDCPTSRPADFVVTIFSVLAPVFALQAMHYDTLTPSRILLIAVVSYVFARYGIREFIKRFTVHRGIIHSIPMALIWGCVVFLSFRHSSRIIQYLVGISSVVGFLTHLIIDEMFSLVDISGGKFTPKKSLGSALKFFSHSLLANLLIYVSLIILLFMCGVQVGFFNKG